MCKLDRIEHAIVLCSNDCSANIMLVDFGEDGTYLKNDILTLSYDTFKKEEDKLKLRRGDIVEVSINIKRPPETEKVGEEDVRDLEEGFREQNEEHWFNTKLPIDYFKDLQKSLSECIDAQCIILKNKKALCPNCKNEVHKITTGRNYYCDACKLFLQSKKEVTGVDSSHD